MHLISFFFQNFVQSLSNMLMDENIERWEEAQLVGVPLYSHITSPVIFCVSTQ